MMAVDEEQTHILGNNTDQNNYFPSLHVYKRRWWVLFVFCYAGFTQSLIWVSWGPIAESSEIAFGWTDGTLAAVTNMATILFAVFVLPFSGFMDTRGLRTAMLISSTALLACAMVRCFTLDPGIFTPLAYISSALQGLGGLASYSGLALVAALWFPLNERATITAIASFFANFGVTIAFILHPQLVPSPVFVCDITTHNSTGLHVLHVEDYCNTSNATNITNTDTTLKVVDNLDSIKTGIQHLMYLHSALSGLGLFFVIVYFPAKPHKPPSITASLPRPKYKEVVKQISRNGQLWIVIIAGTLPRACVGMWGAVFDVVAKQLGVSQIDAGWIAFWHTLIGIIAAIALAKCSDLLNNRRKLLVISMTIAAVLCCIWVALLCDRMIEFNIESLYVSCILLGFLVNGITPLFFEMTAEAAYPIGEGVAGGIFTLGFSVFMIAYLGLLSVPGIGVSWMTWSCVGSLIVSIPLLVIFKERNKRYNIDSYSSFE